MYAQQDVLMTLRKPHCSVDIYARAILLSNTIRARKHENFFLGWLFLSQQFSAISPEIFRYISNYLFINCNACPKKKYSSKSGIFIGVGTTRH